MIEQAELPARAVNAASRRRVLAAPPARRTFAVSTWGVALVAHAALLTVAATLTAAVARHSSRPPDLAPVRLELGGTGHAGFSAPSGREGVTSRRPDMPDLPPGEIETAALPAPDAAASFLDGPPEAVERPGHEDLLAGYLPGTRSHGRPGHGRGIRPGRGETGGDPTGGAAPAPGGGGPGAAEGVNPAGGGGVSARESGGGGGDGWARRRGGRLPRYPVTARRRGWEGTVTLSLEVAADGAVTEVTVQESSGHQVLDDEAVEAAKSWTFAPALQDGRLAATHVTMPVTFRLTE